MEAEIDEIGRQAGDRLRIPPQEEVDPVLRLDDVLLDDQFFTLVFLDFGLEPLDGQFGAAGRFFFGNRHLETLFLKRDHGIERSRRLSSAISV